MKNPKLKQTGTTAARLFLPIHQDHLFEALATGFVQLRGRRPMHLGEVSHDILTARAHGFDYGLVGLLELIDEKAAMKFAASRKYVLLSECIGIWVATEDDVVELDARVKTFGDTVPDALEFRHDVGLFASVQAGTSASIESPEQELPLDGGAEGSELTYTESPEEGELQPLRAEKVAGAISMLRYRALGISNGLDRLSKALGPMANDRGAGSSSFEWLVASSLGEPNPNGDQLDARVVGAAAEMLVTLDSRNGLSPLDFATRLQATLSGGEQGNAMAEATEKLKDIVRRVAANELELTTANIQDGGKVGLRALVVFLLAPEPERLLKWLAARPAVGDGVSLVASFLSGLFSGQGKLPATVKGPGRNAFLAPVLLGHQWVEGKPDLAMDSLWESDGSRVQRIMVGSMELARAVEPPAETTRMFLELAQREELTAMVDAATGAISLRVEGMQTTDISVDIGPSHWLPFAGEVATMGVLAKGKGRGQLPKSAVELLLHDAMPPVWASLGEATGQVVLRVEAGIKGDAALQRAIDCLISRMEMSGLVVWPVKKPPAKRSKEKAKK